MLLRHSPRLLVELTQCHIAAPKVARHAAYKNVVLGISDSVVDPIDGYVSLEQEAVAMSAQLALI
jgi:hypothetical protein